MSEEARPENPTPKPTLAMKRNRRAFLRQQAEQAREMHRLYPFTRTVSSAARRAAKKAGGL